MLLIREAIGVLAGTSLSSTICIFMGNWKDNGLLGTAFFIPPSRMMRILPSSSPPTSINTLSSPKGHSSSIRMILPTLGKSRITSLLSPELMGKASFSPRISSTKESSKMVCPMVLGSTGRSAWNVWENSRTGNLMGNAFKRLQLSYF